MRSVEEDLFGTTRKRKGINSKKKGDLNERNLAKVISLWTGEKFTKVPSSGGLDWGSNYAVTGDIVCTNVDFDFKFCIETKHYKNLPMEGQLRSNSKVFKFWEQCIRDADKVGKVGLMALRMNGMKSSTWVVFFKKRLFSIPLVCQGKYEDYNIYGYNSEDIFNTKYNQFIKLF